jgi:AcrR family transcriptional regulator
MGTTRQPKARRGRPKGGSSDETRKALVDRAREHFAEKGYSSTSLVAVAQDVGIATSAVYHYFSGKDELYEAVYDETAPAVWGQMARSIEGVGTMIEGIELLLRGRGGERPEAASPFLAGMPTVARLHPELHHLLERRIQTQQPVFEALASLGIANGELPGFELQEATELLRSLVMGWFFERFWLGQERPGSVDGVLHAFRAIAASATALETDPT